MNKKCSKCKKILPVSLFGKQNQRKDGLHIYCKSCHNRLQRIRRQTPEYKIYHKEYRKEYRKRIINDIRLKYLCRRKTGHLAEDGIIKKEPCCICGNKKVESHHFDYKNPKDIIWLCNKHHNELHQYLKNN